MQILNLLLYCNKGKGVIRAAGVRKGGIASSPLGQGSWEASTRCLWKGTKGCMGPMKALMYLLFLLCYV